MNVDYDPELGSYRDYVLVGQKNSIHSELLEPIVRTTVCENSGLKGTPTCLFRTVTGVSTSIPSETELGFYNRAKQNIELLTNLQTALSLLETTSGLVVKSIVAIDGPRVRFAASAVQYHFALALSLYLILELIVRLTLRQGDPEDWSETICADKQGLRVDVTKSKDQVEKAAQAAGIPVTVILPGVFAESGLNKPPGVWILLQILGVDIPGNRIIYSGNSAHQKVDLCFLTGTLVSELRVTGEEFRRALQKKHGKPPQVIEDSVEKVEEIESCIRQGIPLALGYYERKVWGTG
ncbi:hypothetical protein SCAR479_11568 [Seiridium cardinale]|uniref:Uncharacterized protein n=1 Tax=Seiridium cardinale TaxID=138064 RepID=A0ABR2XD71_9PEZI